MTGQKMWFWAVVVLALAGAAYFIMNPDLIGKKTVSALCAGGNVVVKIADSKMFGTYLTSPSCQTLYVHADDTFGQTACQGMCNDVWLPYDYNANFDPASYAGDDFGKRLGILHRPDNIYQYTFDDKALYFYAGDASPGEARGHGQGMGKWTVVPTGGNQ